MRTSGIYGIALLTALMLLAAVPAIATDIFVPADYGTIQEAVDAAGPSGDTIHIAPGTYREQIKIEIKSLDLVGSGPITIIEAVDPIDRELYDITQWTGSVKTIDACIGIVGPGTVNISDLTVDGRELGPDGFYGIHFFDADGSVTNCRIEDVLNAGGPGSQNVVSIVTTHSETGTCDVEFTGNVIPNFQKGAIVVMGPASVCDITGNDIDNAPSAYNAGNGIQVSYGSTGTVTDNDVTGVAYTGEDWGATGILCFESGDVAVSGGQVDQCQMGLNFSQWNWIYDPTVDAVISFDGVTFDQCDWSVACHLGDPGAGIDLTVQNCVVSNGTYTGVDLWGSDIDPWGGGYYGGWTSGLMDVGIFDNTISAGDGIVEYIEVAGGTVNIEAHGNDLGTSGDYGVYNNYTNDVDATDNWWGDPAGPTLVTARGAGAGAKLMPSPYSATDEAVPAGGSGQASSPEGESPRAGVNVSTGVIYTPFLVGNVYCDPDPEYLTVASPTKTIDVNYLGGGSGLLYGYSIKFSWDGAIVTTAPGTVTEGSLLSSMGSTFFFAATTGANEITVDCALLGEEPGVTGPGTLFSVDFTGLAVGTSDIDITVLEARDADNVHLTGFFDDDGLLIVDVQAPVITDVFIENLTLAHTDDYIKDGDAAQVTATVTDDDPAFGVANIVADLSGLGGGAAVNPDTYVGNLATWTLPLASVTCTPADGTVTVTVDATDPIGNPAAQGSDTIIADNTLPTAVTGFDAAVGNEQCDLTWTMGTDLYLDGVTVRRLDNPGEYPNYPLFVGAWPVVDAFYPVDHTDGVEVYNGPLAAATDPVVPRNIYYYQAFCYDVARNYGVADPTARDLSNNYWLGDIATIIGVWGYNGLVNDADIDKLGGTYQVAAPGAPDWECDVGPTVHPIDHRLGLPLPDAYVQFEDLMIFAMNYGRVSPRIVPFLAGESVKALSLELAETGGNDDGEIQIAMRLAGNAAEVKGLSAEIAFDPSELEFVTARLSDEMVSPLAPVFFWHGSTDESVALDMAVLGTDVTVGGSGDVAVLTFRALGDDYALDFTSAALRGAGNEDLHAELDGCEAKPGIPTTYRLVQNAPNPFNPTTKIAFSVPHESPVSIRVYDVTGRLVSTLVDGVVEAGSHEVVWRGTNEAGVDVGSGVYFCTMEAQGFHDSRKMLLLK
jgi:hypothetical protein